MMSIFNWGFRATKTLKQSDESINLSLKSGDQIKLNELIKQLPSLKHEKLTLHPLLFNGTLQSLYYGKANSEDKFQVYYGREIFKFEDGGICSLDWVKDEESKEIFNAKYQETLPENWPKLLPRTRFFDKDELDQIQTPDPESTKPYVVIFHGIGGSSHELLVRNFAQLLTSGKNKHKFDVVISCSRGCGRTKVTSDRLFTAISTDDIEAVILDLKRRGPNRPIYTVGFSFGAVLLINYLGFHKNDSAKLIKGASVVGCPFDLLKSIDGLSKSWSGYYLFNPAVASFLNKLVKNNFKELHHFNPDLIKRETLELTMKAKDAKTFDNHFTCKTAGFDNADDYYKKSSPELRIKDIQVPFLSISSWDDPTNGGHIPSQLFINNPYTASLETDLGGHLAFVTPDKQFWCVRVIDEFIESLELVEGVVNRGE